MNPAPPPVARFRVGDRVLVPRRPPVVGEIVEDRGLLGRHGRRLYAVEIPMDTDEPFVSEYPEDHLEPAGPEDTEIDLRASIDYLKEQGLVAILMAKVGVRMRMRVWLRKDGLGNVVHTFKPGLGLIGGQVVPPGALHGRDRISGPSVPEVIEFLEGFGLDESQAKEVVEAVGTAP